MDSTNSPARYTIEVADRIEVDDMFNAIDLCIDYEHHSLSIAEARNLSMALACAADEAELKLPQ
jgi:hypothetical protein